MLSCCQLWKGCYVYCYWGALRGAGERDNCFTESLAGLEAAEVSNHLTTTGMQQQDRTFICCCCEQWCRAGCAEFNCCTHKWAVVPALDSLWRRKQSLLTRTFCGITSALVLSFCYVQGLRDCKALTGADEYHPYPWWHAGQTCETQC